MLRRLTALGLAIAHGILLSAGSLHRHAHDLAGIDPSVLPAEYHFHDYGLREAAGNALLPAVDDCIACQLKRAVAFPLPPVTCLLGGAAGNERTEPPRTIVRAHPLDDLLPRAPPV
jgi:hypothetical protein